MSEELKALWRKIVRYRRRMSIWSNDDVKEIGESVRYAFYEGTDDDRSNCELWLRFEAQVADECRVSA